MGLFSINKEKMIYAIITLLVVVAIITYLKGWVRQ